MSEDLLVVVPGITGSVLRSTDREVWNLSVSALAHGLGHTGAVLEAMSLPEGLGDQPAEGGRALHPSGLITGFHVWPGFWAGAGYGRLLRDVRRLDPQGERTLAFAYDWRLSNRYTARLLKTAVERRLAAWRERPGQRDARAVFICHSMGGLIAQYYIAALGGGEITRRVITIGTPFSGSVKAVQALTGGLLPHLPALGGIAEKLTTAARSFPSVAQLLPTYNCVATRGGVFRLADASVRDLPTSAVADAARFAQEIGRGGGQTAPDAFPPLHVIVGYRQPTLQSVRVDNGIVTYQRSQRGQDHLGDGTVPRFSAVPSWWKDDADCTLVAGRHSALQRDEYVLDAVRNKVAALVPGAILASDIEMGMDLPEIAASGTPFAVTVTADRDDLLIRAEILPLAESEAADEGEMLSAGDCTYTVALTAPPGLWRVRATTYSAKPYEFVEDVIVVV